jgi:hypothetical protein
MLVAYAALLCLPLLLIRSAMLVGYARVSTRDQHVDAQQDALAAAGCEPVYVDSASGKLASRPGLEKALLSANRAGDQLVVTKLDRLGRSLENLIELASSSRPRAWTWWCWTRGSTPRPRWGRCSSISWARSRDLSTP